MCESKGEREGVVGVFPTYIIEADGQRGWEKSGKWVGCPAKLMTNYFHMRHVGYAWQPVGRAYKKLMCIK